MRLTSRQEEILVRIIQGDGAQEIADSLGISLRTVEAGYKNLREKARARNTAHLAALAVYHGWYRGKIKRMETEDWQQLAAIGGIAEKPQSPRNDRK